MESITIPNAVTELKDRLFSDSGVKYVTLPLSVKTISQKAFERCPKLKYIYIPKGSTEQFKKLLEPEFHSKLKEK